MQLEYSVSNQTPASHVLILFEWFPDIFPQLLSVSTLIAATSYCFTSVTTYHNKHYKTEVACQEELRFSTNQFLINDSFEPKA
jgi:hypothetical protein